MKVVRKKKKDMAAAVGLPVRGERQSSRKEEGSEEEKEKWNRHEEGGAEIRKVKVKVGMNTPSQLYPIHERNALYGVLAAVACTGIKLYFSTFFKGHLKNKYFLRI